VSGETRTGKDPAGALRAGYKKSEGAIAPSSLPLVKHHQDFEVAMNKGTHFSGQPILAQIVKLIPQVAVQRLARTHGTDRYYKKFKTYDHVVAMLYTIFGRCTSIREVVTGMLACENRLKHAGVTYIPRRSTLSDANCRRDAKVFEALYGYLYRRYASGLPDSHQEKWMSKLFIVDSTTISLFQEILKTVGRTPLNGKRKGGVKAHTLMKADEDVPRLVRLTAASTHDHTFLKEIDLPTGSIITFDRAYVDYAVYNRWTALAITFVTRLKTNTVLKALEERPVSDEEKENGVVSDTVSELGHAEQQNKVTGRLIVYTYKDARTKRQRTLRFFTNNLEMDASTIARIYRQRWQIEMLFKRIKQNFPLQYFLGDNENAIKIQIWCALIADLLLKVIRRGCERDWSFANLASMVRHHLMNYIDLRGFLNNPEKAILEARRMRPSQPAWSLFPT
jgi:hypothetical protein